MFTATVPAALPSSPSLNDYAQMRAVLNKTALTRTVNDPYRISALWSLGGSAQGGGGNKRSNRPSRAGYTANIPAGARAMAV